MHSMFKLYLPFLMLFMMGLLDVLDHCPAVETTLFSTFSFLTVSHLFPEYTDSYWNPFFHQHLQLPMECFLCHCHTTPKLNRSPFMLNSWRGVFFLPRYYFLQTLYPLTAIVFKMPLAYLDSILHQLC